MEAEQPAALVQSVTEQVDFDEVHLTSFSAETHCVCGAGHILPWGLVLCPSPAPICPLAIREDVITAHFVLSK